MWAGGGNWDDASSSPPADDPPKPAAAQPGRKTRGSFGPDERLGASGLVAGRFLPLHRGHQYLIEFARKSVERLTILVFADAADPITGETRVNWLRELYPDVAVVECRGKLAAGDREFATKFARIVARTLPGESPSHFFSSELAYRAAADALGARFVPVDPTRAAIPTSGSAIRANVMESFQFLARTVRPWFVRRVAVVGAESTGKSTLCARLREQFRMLVVPEWTRVLIESGPERLTSDQIQLVARSQIASEDALANQLHDANGGVLLCDTDLRTVALWSERLFEGGPPAWIAEQIDARPYDLYLQCGPDVPFVGAREWDRPADRLAFHDRLHGALRDQPVIELRGSRDERFKTAADAIIALFTPTTLLSARGARMTG